MYSPREPSGCMESLLVMRLLIGIVLIPTAILIAAIIAVIGAFYALQVHPLLGLLVVVICAGILIGVALWERNRVARQLMGPQDDDN